MSTGELERLSVIQKIVDKSLTQVLASKQLGLTDRQVRRLVKNYKLYGAEGLTSKQRGQIGNRKYTDEKIEVIKTLVVKHYYDFGPKFAAEKLYEKHAIKVNKETLRQWMVDGGYGKLNVKSKLKFIHNAIVEIVLVSLPK